MPIGYRFHSTDEKLVVHYLKRKVLSLSLPTSNLRAALAGPSDILVTTPKCIRDCLSAGLLQPASINESLKILVLDEADLLLQFGFGDDLKAPTPVIPRHCQCLLMSATSSLDVDQLKKLILHNPFVLTLSEVEDVKDEVILKKRLAILDFMQCELKLFFEKFGIKSAILNAELPQNSHLHILEEFNARLFFDYLIAIEDSQTKQKEQANGDKHVESR